MPPPPSRASFPWYIVLSALAGAVFLGLFAWAGRDRIFTGRNDFMQLYSGARLLGSPDLYSPEANQRIHLREAGVALEGVLSYNRLPFYALALKPLAWMPYLAAYAVFQLLSAGALAGFLRMYLGRTRELLLFSSLSIPLLTSFANGQDAVILLFLTGLSVDLARRGRDGLSGAVLALCTIKFHLFVLVPIALIAQRRWRILKAAVVTVAALIVVSLLAAGPAWPARYLALVLDPGLSPNAALMPNLKGLIAVAGGGSKLLLAAVTIAVVAATVWLCRRAPNYEAAFAWALVGGLLAGYHSYIQDCALLLVVFAIVVENYRWPPLRGFTALCVLPPLYLLVLAGPPASATAPACLLALVAFGIAESRISRLLTPPPPATAGAGRESVP